MYSHNRDTDGCWLPNSSCVCNRKTYIVKTNFVKIGFFSPGVFRLHLICLFFFMLLLFFFQICRWKKFGHSYLLSFFFLARETDFLFCFYYLARLCFSNTQWETHFSVWVRWTAFAQKKVEKEVADVTDSECKNKWHGVANF